MSSSLRWRPDSPDSERVFTYSVKAALRKKFGEPIHGGRLSENDWPYLQGLRDAGVEGIQEVMDAIELHGAIILDEVY